MKINHLELENFKVFKSEKFNFKRITILAGANSAGKSTVLNALASILQGGESRPFPFYFSNYGDNVHLGGFKDIVRGGNTSNKFSIGISFENNKKTAYAKGTYRYASNGQQILIDDLMIKNKTDSLNVKWEGQNKGYKGNRSVQEGAMIEEKRLSSLIVSSLTELFSEIGKDHSKEDMNRIINEFTSSNSGWRPIENKSSRDLFSALSDYASYHVSINAYKRSFADLLSSTYYIGPIRPYPSRHYFLSSYQDRIDALGANAFQLLIGWYKSDTKKFKKITQDLKILKLAESLDADPIKDELVELNVQPIGQKYSVNLSDVGFGLSQILPILVANASAKKDSTLLINQPEVHLHPSSQAMLANYFCTESKDKNFIIETHSEYLINRIRLLVAKGELNPKDVSIIYIDNGEDEPEVGNIEIDKSGALHNAPASFFDTYYADNNELVFASIGED